MFFVMVPHSGKLGSRRWCSEFTAFLVRAYALGLAHYRYSRTGYGSTHYATLLLRSYTCRLRARCPHCTSFSSCSGRDPDGSRRLRSHSVTHSVRSLSITSSLHKMPVNVLKSTPRALRGLAGSAALERVRIGIGFAPPVTNPHMTADPVLAAARRVKKPTRAPGRRGCWRRWWNWWCRRG